jgi:hypothetical protein
MKTVERDREEEKQVPHRRFAAVRNDKESLSGNEGFSMRNAGDETGRWARVCAIVGAAAWAGIAVLARVGIARIGSVELLFLFAPLVIVPLGMELSRAMGAGGLCLEVARRIQPLAAATAVIAVCMPPGRKAAIVAAGWLVVCGLMAWSGLTDLIRTIRTRAEMVEQIALAVARIDLAVGGAWLVASRLGMHPMGIQEPIGLLTAVHFHFAGLATALIAAATLRFAEKRSIPSLSHITRQGWGTHALVWLKAIVILVIGMPYVVAAGFVISPALKMGAAVVFSVSVAALAVRLRGCMKNVSDFTARVLLQVASGAVFAAMIFSAAYAVADFAGSDALTIPQMARTHGLLNAFGFCLSGLLGWLIEIRGQGSEARG